MSDPLPSAHVPPIDSGVLILELPRGPSSLLRITATQSKDGRPIIRLREWLWVAADPATGRPEGWWPKPGRWVTIGVEDGEAGMVAGVLGMVAGQRSENHGGMSSWHG